MRFLFALSMMVPLAAPASAQNVEQTTREAMYPTSAIGYLAKPRQGNCDVID